MKLAVRTALSAILLLGGCATSPVGFATFQQREAALAAFQNGDAQLTCLNAQCLAAWNVARPAAARALSTGVWDDVAADVLAANYNQDLGWYYLGTAASALGYREAARSYFGRSVQASMAGGPQTCSPVCDGANLPNDARIALAGLAPTPIRTVARRRPAPRRVTPASAAPNWVSPTTGTASSGSGSSGSGSGSWVAPVAGGGSSAPSGGGGWVSPVPNQQ